MLIYWSKGSNVIACGTWRDWLEVYGNEVWEGFWWILKIFGERVPWLGAGVQPGFCVYGFGGHWVSQQWVRCAWNWAAAWSRFAFTLQGTADFLMVDVAFEVVTRQDDVRSNLILMDIFFDKVLNTLPCQHFPEEAIQASPRDRFSHSSFF